MMGRVQSIDAAWDLLAMSMYGTITSIAESPRERTCCTWAPTTVSSR